MKRQQFELPIHQLFEAQAEASPSAVAAVFKQEQLTYDSLNRRANQLAHYLRRLGVGPEAIVALHSERSLEMLIALFAVLKTGAAYLPLNREYSPQRLSQILKETVAPIVITREQLSWQPPDSKLRVIALDAERESISSESDHNPDNLTEIDNLAYVIYTSGTTGTPKGVMVTHRGLTNHSLDIARQYALQNDDRVLQFAAPSFDVAAEEIFPTLLSGAAIILRTDEMLSSPGGFGSAAEEMGVTVMNLPASYWREWVDQLSNADEHVPSTLRLLVVGSEKVPTATYAAWRKIVGDNVRCVNAYGLTETTITSTIHDPAEPVADQYCLPIGRPIANTHAYVLDEDLRPVASGTPGELCIGGAGLARGYLALPALTAEKFIPDPVSAEPGARLYKTGDSVRLLPDGNLEFLGRLDRQVKVRGFRIEPGEVESVIAQHPAIARAVVTDHIDSSGNTRLIAYVIQSAKNVVGAIESEQLSQWQLIHDDEVSNQVSASQDPTLNISGWNSSYDGLPISEAEMREWVDDSVGRILSQHPDRILEIGCGTGLLLLRLAPHCASFLGTDFSRVGLAHIQKQLEERPMPHVSLLERSAENFEGFEENSFDAIVLNSVIQYFPTADYLVRVLEGATRVLTPGGVIFVGDVRSLPLLPAFHASVELQKADAQLSTEQLSQRIRMRVAHEEELVIDPEFFFALKRRLPKISHVEVMPKRARHLNEMSKFRYNAIIHAGEPAPLFAVDEPVDWNNRRLSMDEVRKLLVERETLVITDVPNARIATDVRLVELLNRPERPATVAELKKSLRDVETGVEPEDFRTLADELGYQVELSFARHGSDGRYDVSFRRRASSELFPFPQAPAVSEPSSYTNNPLLDKQAQQFVPELMNFAKAQLPAYMVPSTFVLLDKLPLTTNGKIDYRALPVPENIRTKTEGDVPAPRTRTEILLAEIWQEVLDVDQVGINDNFFDCGGHSLRALRVLSRVRQSFKVELSLTDIFITPTLAGFAALIDRKQLESTTDDEDESSNVPQLKPIPRDDSALPLSFAQEAMWAFEQSSNTNPYNIPVAWRLEGPLDAEALKRALNEVLNRHEVLRMRFVSRAGHVVQIPEQAANLQLPYADLRDLAEVERQARLEQERHAEARERFDLEHGPLIRGRLLRLADEEHVLLLTLHVLAGDAASVAILKGEAAMLYQAFVNGQPSPLSQLPVQYADYAAWQREWLQGKALEEQVSYWRQQLGESPPVLDFPPDKRLPTNGKYLGADHRYPVDEVPMILAAGLVEALNALSRSHNVTLYMTLLAAFKALLFRYTQQPAIIVGTPISGRTRKETEILIGLFVNNLAIRSDLSDDQTFDELLKQVREATMGAFTHQDLPYEKLVDELRLGPDRSHIPLFQAMFILQNARPAALRASKGINLKLSTIFGMSELTKYDLSVTVVEMPGDYNGWIQYRSDLFDAATIVQLAGNYRELLADVAANPERRLGELLPSLKGISAKGAPQ